MISKQPFTSPKNAAKIVERTTTAQSLSVQKGIQLEKALSHPPRQNGTSIEDIKKLIKSSCNHLHFLKIFLF